MSHSESLPLHIAALLLPYLSPPDLFRAQRVSKHWHSIFSSSDLAKIALRTYGAASYEQYQINIHSQQRKPADLGLNYLDLFRAFSIRTRNLRRGIANQEIRFHAKRAWSGEYVWCFGENYLVYISPDYTSGLTVVYFDDERQTYIIGRIELGVAKVGDEMELSVFTIRAVRISAGVLLIEHVKEVTTSDGQRSSRFVHFAQCFKLTQPVYDDEKGTPPSVGIEKLSEFQTFDFLYIDFTYALISDHTARHLAMMNTRANSGPIRSGIGIFVWSIETGKLIYHVSVQKKSLPMGVMEVARGHQNGNERLMIVGDNHIVLARGDRQNASKFRHSIDEEIGFKVDLETYDLSKGELSNQGVIIASPDDCVHSFVSRLKDDKMLGRYDHYISWNTTKQNLPRASQTSAHESMVFLNIWGKQEGEKQPRGRPSPEIEQTIQYHIKPESMEGELPPHSVYTHIDETSRHSTTDDDDTPLPLSAEVPIDTSFFMNSSTVDGMSFDLAWSGGSKDIFGTRLMGFDFRIRNFQPSSRPQRRRGDVVEPLKYHLNYSSFLKDKEKTEEKRIIPSITRNVMTGADRITRQFVMGDERMTVYTDLKEERASADLVLSVWQAREFEKV